MEVARDANALGGLLGATSAVGTLRGKCSETAQDVIGI